MDNRGKLGKVNEESSKKKKEIIGMRSYQQRAGDESSEGRKGNENIGKRQETLSWQRRRHIPCRNRWVQNIRFSLTKVLHLLQLLN